jgi:hypothetical protein
MSARGTLSRRTTCELPKSILPPQWPASRCWRVAWQCCAVAAARNLKDCAASLPLPNTYWVISGRVLAGEYPGVANDTESRSRLARLHEAGIDSFLDLTEDGELPPYRPALAEGRQADLLGHLRGVPGLPGVLPTQNWFATT